MPRSKKILKVGLGRRCRARGAARPRRAPKRPTPILTDNKANLLIARSATSASRAKHFLRRYITLQQRIASDELVVVKVDDANMPSDFLTKWLPSAKLRKSLVYATNSKARAS